MASCSGFRRKSLELAPRFQETTGETMAKETFTRTKPHVNVGTIGHIDHGKTTLTAAILAVLAERGKAKTKSYQDIAKGGTVRDSTKTVTIAVSHVEYESEKRHYAAHRLPGSRGLHQEHDHGRGPDGRRDPGGLGSRRSHAPDAGAHPARTPGRRAGPGRFPQQDRPGRRRGAARARRARAARAAHPLQVPGRRDPDRARQQPAGA